MLVATHIGAMDSPALGQCRIEVEREVDPRICRVAVIPADRLSHLGDQTGSAGSKTRRVRHDEEESLVYREVNWGIVGTLAIGHC